MSTSLKTLFEWFPVVRKLFEAKTAEEFDDFLDRHFEECVQRMEAEAHNLNGTVKKNYLRF